MEIREFVKFRQITLLTPFRSSTRGIDKEFKEFRVFIGLGEFSVEFREFKKFRDIKESLEFRKFMKFWIIL